MTAEELFKLAEDAEKNNELEKALEYYEQAANLGYLPAMLKFSMIKLELENPNPDAAEDLLILGEKASEDRNDADAIKYFEQAANAGNVKAMVKLGQIYELEDFSFMGVKLRKNDFFDEKRAFYWYKKAADAGNAYAMNAVGYMYENGIGTDRNLELAKEYINKAAENYDADAMYNMVFYGAKDNVQKFELLKRAAENGSYNAMSRIGEMYEYGKGVEEDIVEAYIWYERAVHDWDTNDQLSGLWNYIFQKAKQGDPDSMLALAKIQERGYGVAFLSQEGYLQKALNWYKKAAEAGNKEAIDYLNQLALDNFDDYFKNVRKKRMPGFKLTEEKPSKERLVFLAKKAESAGNLDEAFELYLRAAKQGDNFAMFKVGDFYTSQKNDAEAFKWHIKAAENGASYAMTEVATMYFKGAGVEKNEEEGLKWLKKAAELKNPTAMAMLARMYELGIIVEPDIHEALKWYVDAANAGERHAKERLKTLFDKGN